jgi:hypothetical protein
MYLGRIIILFKLDSGILPESSFSYIHSVYRKNVFRQNVFRQNVFRQNVLWQNHFLLPTGFRHNVFRQIVCTLAESLFATTGFRHTGLR